MKRLIKLSQPQRAAIARLGCSALCLSFSSVFSWERAAFTRPIPALSTLRSLAKHKIIEAKSDDSHPLVIRYALTDVGINLIPRCTFDL